MQSKDYLLTEQLSHKLGHIQKVMCKLHCLEYIIQLCIVLSQAVICGMLTPAYGILCFQLHILYIIVAGEVYGTGLAQPVSMTESYSKNI